MAVQSNAPVIIKRKKVVAGYGHHGGAWKVAYADFVTAMMAFFMLMWLLNSTSEQQRTGLADYFAPSIPLSQVSAGGEGMFGGVDIATRDTFIKSGDGGTPDLGGDGGAVPPDVAALEELESILIGQGGEVLLSDRMMRHVVTRITDEGLVIELFDVPDAPLFDGVNPSETTQDLAKVIARVATMVTNGIAIEGHVAARPLVIADNPVWQLSTDHAAVFRTLLEGAGLPPERLRRVTGHADREPADPIPTALRNNRLEVILLRGPLR